VILYTNVCTIYKRRDGGGEAQDNRRIEQKGHDIRMLLAVALMIVTTGAARAEVWTGWDGDKIVEVLSADFREFYQFP
jgi:hypothetical protein